jgi:hypothetical protein
MAVHCREGDAYDDRKHEQRLWPKRETNQLE